MSEEARAAGTTVATRYVLDRKLGEGAFGEVWAARDVRAFDRPVAIKVLLEEHLTNKDVVARFFREAKATAALNHPNVVAMLKYGEHEGVPFIVSELVAGDDLRVVIQNLETEGKQLSLDDAMVIFRQICAAVGAAHQKGIVHRDLKPENVKVRNLGPDAHVTVLDFGLARIISGDTNAAAGQKTEAGRVMGSLKYMSPEQVLGDTAAIDERTDVFALCAVFFELLTSQRAFDGPDYTSVVMKILTGQRPTPSRFRPQLTQEVDDLFEHGFAINREQRFPSVPALLEAAEAVIAAVPLTDDAPRPRRRTLSTQASGLEGAGATPYQPTSIGAAPGYTGPGVNPTQIGAPVAPPPSKAGLYVGLVLGLGAIGVGAAFALRPSPPPAAIPAESRPLPAVDVVAVAVADSAPSNAPPPDTIDWVSVPAPAAPIALGREPGVAGRLSFAAAAGVTYSGGAFTVMIHEVTWSVYETWAEGHPDRLASPPSWVPREPAARAQFPVTNMGWANAQSFCRALGGDLPTEEQWEYVARGAVRRLNPWGAAPPTLEQVGAFRGIDAVLQAVESNPFDRTPESIADLGGNAQEWTASRYRTDEGELPAWTESLRTIRGLPLREARPRVIPAAGLFRNSGCIGDGCTSGDREALEGVGFRCVRLEGATPPVPGAAATGATDGGAAPAAMDGGTPAAAPAATTDGSAPGAAAVVPVG